MQRIPIITALVFLLVSCGSKDSDIKAYLHSKAKDQAVFSGVHYTVDHGAVTLTGSCPDSTAREKIKSTVSALPGVKGLIDQLTVAPVSLGSDYTLQKKADSVLSTCPGLLAEVRDSALLLEGRAPGKALQKARAGIDSLYPRSVEDHSQAE